MGDALHCTSPPQVVTWARSAVTLLNWKASRFTKGDKFHSPCETPQEIGTKYVLAAVIGFPTVPLPRPTSTISAMYYGFTDGHSSRSNNVFKQKRTE